MVAAAPDAPYIDRVAAASNLPSPQTASLGSRELELLASADHSVEAARQPYFFVARLAAAVAPANRAQLIPLLREAIAIAPAESAAHLRLFQAEVEAGHTEAALAVFASFESLPPPPAQRRADSPAADPPDTPDAEPMEQSAPGATPLPRIAEGSSLSEQIQLAELLAKLHEDAQQPSMALGYLQTAIALQPDAAHKAALQQRYDALQASVQLEQRNASRRPQIHAALDQANLVRPRMTLADLAHESAVAKEAP